VHAGADRRDAGRQEGVGRLPGRRARERPELARAAAAPDALRARGARARGDQPRPDRARVRRARAEINPEWTTALPPFQIADNLYYVGSQDLAAYLVTTPAGNILINANLETSPPQIRASVEKLGFKWADTKILLNSQAHFDHMAGAAQILRETGVVGKFVEYFGHGLDTLPLADRATIGNMSPEYGATCGFFPVDKETLRYLEFTGRPTEQIELVDAYTREQGLFHAEPFKNDLLPLWRFKDVGEGVGRRRLRALPRS
jgi:hypothetical protein